MKDDLKEGIKAFKSMSKGDAAALLIRGVTGAMIDAAFNPVAFLTWKETGLLSRFGRLRIEKVCRGRFGILAQTERAKAKTRQRKRARRKTS